MGRGGEKVGAGVEAAPAASESQVAAQGKGAAAWDKVVRIDGVEYDVTQFMRKHPGGSVIQYALASGGADATHVFNAFHLRSKKARKVLATLPRRAPVLELQPGQVSSEAGAEGAMLRDFEELESGLARDGFFEVSYLHNLYRFAELAALFALGLWLFSLRTPLAIAGGVAVHGLFGGRCGWVQHELNHGSMTRTVWMGKLLQPLFIGFGLGASGDMWSMMHNKHHAATQKVNHDLDLDTTPLVAFFDTAFEKNRWKGFARLWVRFQALSFIPITSGCFVMWFWLLFLHPRRVITHGKWHEGFWMLAGHVVRTYLFMQATGWQGVAASYAVGYWACMWVSGMYLFGHFSLSHTHLDVVDEDVHKSWPRYAIDHTVNIEPQNPVVSWLMGYLNCQIEHHLWPQMPQYRQPEASLRVQAFCAKHGLDYKVVSYPRAWYEMLGNLVKVGDHYYQNGVQRVETSKDK
jgi:fatty acid desaturase 2 (delta-6 desaturase)